MTETPPRTGARTLEIRSPEYSHHATPPPGKDISDVRVSIKEDDVTSPHTKRFLWWRLPKKHWIAAIVGTVLAVLAILLLILFLAVFPALFQKFADKIELSVNYLDLVQLPTDPAARDIGVELSLRLKHDSSLKSRTEAAESTLYYEDAAFGVVTIPPQHLAKGEHEFDILIRDTLRIVNADVFGKVCRDLVTSDSVAVYGKSKVKAHALGLSYGGLDLDREFAIRGINQVREHPPNVTHITIKSCDGPAYKILANITVDNLSQLGLQGIGALNASVVHRSEYLGYGRMLNASQGVIRGLSVLELEITVDKRPAPLRVLKNVLKDVLTAPVLELEITGENPMATNVPMLQSAVAALNVSMFFHEGLGGITLNPKCDTSVLLTAARL